MEIVRNRRKVDFTKKMIMSKLLNNNQNYPSLEQISLMQNMIVMQSSKMKHLWINQYTQVWLY